MLDGYLFSQVAASYGNLMDADGHKVTHINDAIAAISSLKIRNSTVKIIFKIISIRIIGIFFRHILSNTAVQTMGTLR